MKAVIPRVIMSEKKSEKNRSLFDQITNRDIVRDTTLSLKEARIELSRSNDLISEQKDTLDVTRKKIERLEADEALSLWAIDQFRMYGLDSPSTYGSFYIDPTKPGRGPVFGTRNISNNERLFGSQREPIVIWYIVKMAVDMFDNWFKIVEIGKEDDNTLDQAVQKVLLNLNAKKELTRAFIFERRYGTSIILYSTTKASPSETWVDPIYEVNEEGTRAYKGERKIVALTPYPKTKFSIQSYDTDEESIQLGKPKIYDIRRGSNITSIQAHYSRLLHIATNIDEDPIWGKSRVDGIYDDSTGYRNLRWAQYQAWWRVGTGFAHMTFPNATRDQIQTWIKSGYFNDIFTRAFFVSGQGKEDIQFKGVANNLVNPTPFNDTALHNFSMGTGIPKNLLIGAQAGSISGSQTNLTAYDKLISGEQELAEPFVRALINTLMDLGQIDFDRETKEYKVIWAPTFEKSKRETAQIELLREQAREKKLLYMKIDEVRALDGLEPLEDGAGKVVPGLLFKLMTQQPGQPGPLPSQLQIGPFSSNEKDALLEAPITQITLLDEELAQLLIRIKYDQTTHDEAILEAQEIIAKHVDQTRELNLNRLRELTGKAITSEAPEVEMFNEELTAYYLTYFETQLTDVLSNRG